MSFSRNLMMGLILALLILVLVACGSETAVSNTSSGVDLSAETQVVPVESGTYTDVSAAGLAAMLENKDSRLINVHIPYVGDIEGTDTNIPFDQIAKNLDQLPADKDAQIAIYCRSGSMSSISARELVELDYTNVWNLDGGMNAWRAAGNELVNNQ